MPAVTCTQFCRTNPQEGQWLYDVSFSDEGEVVQYLHDDLYMGQP